jgi:hypothetical protein
MFMSILFIFIWHFAFVSTLNSQSVLRFFGFLFFLGNVSNQITMIFRKLTNRPHFPLILQE